MQRRRGLKGEGVGVRSPVFSQNGTTGVLLEIKLEFIRDISLKDRAVILSLFH